MRVVVVVVVIVVVVIVVVVRSHIRHCIILPIKRGCQSHITGGGFEEVACAVFVGSVRVAVIAVIVVVVVATTAMTIASVIAGSMLSCQSMDQLL